MERYIIIDLERNFLHSTKDLKNMFNNEGFVYSVACIDFYDLKHEINNWLKEKEIIDGDENGKIN